MPAILAARKERAQWGARTAATAARQRGGVRDLPRYSRGRIDHDLQVAVPALIEAAKRVRCVCQRQPMADDLAGADTAGGDQVAEEVVVALVVVASHAYRHALGEELSPGDVETPVTFEPVDAV